MQDPLQRKSEVSVDTLFVSVATLLNHELSTNHDVAHSLATQCKNPAIENLVILGRGDERVRAVEDDERISDFWVRASHMESLHPHDAVAVATKGVPGGYSAVPDGLLPR